MTILRHFKPWDLWQFLNLSIYIGIIGDITDEKGFCRRACVLRRRVDVVSLALFRNGRNHASFQNWRHQNFTAFKSRFVRSSWFFQTLWMSSIWVAGRNGKSIALKAWARSSWWMGEKVGKWWRGNGWGPWDELPVCMFFQNWILLTCYITKWYKMLGPQASFYHDPFYSGGNGAEYPFLAIGFHGFALCRALQRHGAATLGSWRCQSLIAESLRLGGPNPNNLGDQYARTKAVVACNGNGMLGHQ